MSSSETQDRTRSRKGILIALGVAAVAVLGVASLAVWGLGPTVVEAGGTRVPIAGASFNLPGKAVARPGHTGNLTVHEDGCLTLTGPDGVERYLLIWPRGTEVSGTGSDVSLTFDDSTVKPGDVMDISGPVSDEVDRYFRDRLPAGCLSLEPLLIERF